MATQQDPVPQSAPLADLGRITQSTVRDIPTGTDALGFTPYVEAIAAFLDSPGTQPPFTLSIEGEWGCGKSSFMKQLAAALEQPGRSPSIPVSFNAWRFDKEDALWAAFALAVTRELRHKSTWPRRVLGALRLSRDRVPGPAAWLRLIAFLAVWALFLSACIFALVALARHPVHQAQAMRALFAPKTPEGHIPEPYATLLSSGSWAGAVAVIAAALARSGSFLKSRLFDIKLEKIIAQPDYSGRAEFIQDFHRDFTATIRAYAGNRKVYVFIDDLDRCDLLKAAELMQAINLMIGDDDHLVFILGIDRDKIAAGIAAKYKDVLPYLVNKGDSTAAITPEDRLAFGQQYLEKFIQLSFRIPLPDEQSVLRHFVDRLTPEPAAAEPAAQPFPQRLIQLVRSALHLSAPAASAAPGNAPATSPAQTASPARPRGLSSPPSDVPTRSYNRVESGKDSRRIVEVVLMVSHLFGNNPRRLKQFLNTYRLSLYLASSQGLLDVLVVGGQTRTPLNLEQLGKIVALLMRFPALYHLLLVDPDLLAKYELYFGTALAEAKFNGKDIPPPPAWLDTFEVRDLLRFGLDRVDSYLYTLRTIDITAILRVMPAVPRPSDRMLDILKSLNIPVPPSSTLGMENFLRSDGFSYSEIRINGGLVATVDPTGRLIADQASTPPPARTGTPPASAPAARRAVPSQPPTATPPPSTAPDRPVDDMPRPAPPAGAFSLVLTHAGKNRNDTLQVLRRITDLSDDEARGLIDNVPSTLFQNVSMEFAMRIGNQLNGIATVQLVSSDEIPGSKSGASNSSSTPDYTKGSGVRDSQPFSSAQVAGPADQGSEPAADPHFTA